MEAIFQRSWIYWRLFLVHPINQTQPHDSQKTILIIGAKGFLGRHFANHYHSLGFTVFETHHDKGTIHFNLNAPSLNDLPCYPNTYALITAGISTINRCEEDKEGTYLVNVLGTLEITRQLIEKKITPILFSTDYVFDGKEQFYTEESPTAPLNEYGRQKSILEKHLSERFPNQYLLMRLSKVFSLNFGDGTLLDEMANKLLSGEKIKAAKDQIFCPILLDDLLTATSELQLKHARGLFNLGGSETWRRSDIAIELSKHLNTPASLIEEISLDELDEPFLRPKCTSLSSKKIHSTLKLSFNPLSTCIKKYANQRVGK